jgi:hypothetical protein
MRIVPVNGAETIYWFADRLTDIGSHTRCAVSYPRAMTMREDINRVMRPVVHAKRVNVSIEVAILSMADHAMLQEIEEALDDTGNYAVFLSLDGGAVEREVVWMGDGGLSPQPLREKTILGARFELALQSKHPIGKRGPMMTDPGVGEEILQNVGFEDWPGASPPGWGDSGDYILTKETTIKHGGANSGKIERSDAVSFGALASDNIGDRLRSGVYHRLSFWVISGGATIPVSGTGPIAVYIYNSTLGQTIMPDGHSIAVTDVVMPIAPVTGSWVQHTAYFRVPQTWLRAHYVDFRFQGYWAGATPIYHDDVSIVRQVLRPGYATW